MTASTAQSIANELSASSCSDEKLAALATGDRLISAKALPPVRSRGVGRIEGVDCAAQGSDDACGARAKRETLARIPGAVWMGTTVSTENDAVEAVVEVDGAREVWREPDSSLVAERAVALAATGKRVTLVSAGPAPGVRGIRRAKILIEVTAPDLPERLERRVELRLRAAADAPEDLAGFQERANQDDITVIVMRRDRGELEIVVGCVEESH